FCGMPDGPSEEVVLPWGYTIALAAIHAVDGAVIHYTERIGVRIVGVLCVPVCKRDFYVGGELSLERMIIREQPSCVGHFAQHPGFAVYLSVSTVNQALRISAVCFVCPNFVVGSTEGKV